LWRIIRDVPNFISELGTSSAKNGSSRGMKISPPSERTRRSAPLRRCSERRGSNGMSAPRSPWWLRC
jgi:hypothetical protein